MNHTHITFPSRRRHDTAGRLLLIGLCLLGFLSLLIPAQAEEVVIYVHTDHLGNPIAYSNEQGVVIQREYYLPYGQALNPDNELDDDSAAFTGHVSDSDTGLVYMQARYYDPIAGRFLSTDPVTFSPDRPEHFNRYWYANGNPINMIDPDGRTAGDILNPGDKGSNKVLVSDGMGNQMYVDKAVASDSLLASSLGTSVGDLNTTSPKEGLAAGVIAIAVGNKIKGTEMVMTAVGAGVIADAAIDGNLNADTVIDNLPVGQISKKLGLTNEIGSVIIDLKLEYAKFEESTIDKVAEATESDVRE